MLTAPRDKLKTSIIDNNEARRTTTENRNKSCIQLRGLILLKEGQVLVTQYGSKEQISNNKALLLIDTLSYRVPDFTIALRCLGAYRTGDYDWI